MRELTLEQRERLARLCEVSDQQVPCQDDIRSLLDIYEQQRAELERLRARVEAVLKLHKESDSTFAGKPWCSMCKDAQNNHVDWPCATVRALEGK